MLLFFSSGINYAEFENSNVVEVENDEVTNSEEHTKPTDKPDDQICWKTFFYNFQLETLISQ